MKPQSNVNSLGIPAEQMHSVTIEKLPQKQSTEEPQKGKVKTSPFDVTQKEIAIIASLAKGNSYKMVAVDCNITINTVRQHIRNIFRKMHINSSMEAVLLAFKHKILLVLFYFNFVALSCD